MSTDRTLGGKLLNGGYIFTDDINLVFDLSNIAYKDYTIYCKRMFPIYSIVVLVAKRKSIFNDRQMEIEELTNIIKTDLKSLNHQIGKLQELSKMQREGYGAAQSHHMASHSSSIVMALQSKLANMSNHFKSVLEVRSEVCTKKKMGPDISLISPLKCAEYEGRAE